MGAEHKVWRDATMSGRAVGAADTAVADTLPMPFLPLEPRP
ncbi:hypothetical protein ACPOLB_19190 [Rubrivivax sp. RP6-9]